MQPYYTIKLVIFEGFEKSSAMTNMKNIFSNSPPTHHSCAHETLFGNDMTFSKSNKLEFEVFEKYILLKTKKSNLKFTSNTTRIKNYYVINKVCITINYLIFVNMYLYMINFCL